MENGLMIINVQLLNLAIITLYNIKLFVIANQDQLFLRLQNKAFNSNKIICCSYKVCLY